MRKYLDNMAAAPYTAIPPTEEPPTLIAALGPKMLELARDKCAGAHPYFSSPAHTRMARDILGPEPMLCVEQKVILETDADKARTAARTVAGIYIDLPNYRNNWLRMGLTEEDLSNGGSDAFIDATFAWGSPEQIRERIEEHYAAGASHVCVQPVDPAGQVGFLDWNVLEELAK